MQITQLFLHSELFIPGIGSITSAGGGATVTTGKGGKIRGLEMQVYEGGVGVKLTVGKTSAIIPWANIKLAIYDSKNS